MRIRTQDCWGAGHFGAPRGERTHRGVDVCCEVAEEVKSLTYGTVTKLGYPYNIDDPKKGHMRYVEVTLDGNRFRYFYVSPNVKVGDKVNPGSVLGLSQWQEPVYPGITQHYHFEIINPQGEYVNPADMLPEFGDGQSA